MNYLKLCLLESKYIWKVNLLIICVIVFMLVPLVVSSSLITSLTDNFDRIVGEKELEIDQADALALVDYCQTVKDHGTVKCNDDSPYLFSSSDHELPSEMNAYEITYSDGTIRFVSESELLQMVFDEAGSDAASWSEDELAEYILNHKGSFEVDYCFFSGKIRFAQWEYYSELCNNLLEKVPEKPTVFLSDVAAAILDVKCGDSLTLENASKTEFVVGGIYSLDQTRPTYIIDGSCSAGLLQEFFPQDVRVVILSGKVYDQTVSYFKNAGFEVLQDETYLQTKFLFSSLICALLILVLSIILTQLGILRWISSFIIDVRKENIFRMKVLGATDFQVSMLYSSIIVPVLLLSSIISAVLSEWAISDLKINFQTLFESQLDISIIGWLIAIIFSAYTIALFVSLYGVLGKRKQGITYELMKRV